jgi:hypothetical protein
MVKGFLHIVTTPVSGDIYINTEYRGTQDLNVILDIGTYTVSFGDITGYVTPSPLTVDVISDHTTIITVEYTK